MKTFIVRLLLPVASLAGLCSCSDLSATRGPGPGVNTAYSSYGTGFVTYSTLPASYVGSTYYVQGKHYAGGRHETGSYRHQGRTYASRYYHNGRYYYGGVQQQHSGLGTPEQRYVRGTSRRDVVVGSNVNTTPMAATSSNMNADIHTTAATRGPAVSFTFR